MTGIALDEEMEPAQAQRPGQRQLDSVETTETTKPATLGNSLQAGRLGNCQVGWPLPQLRHCPVVCPAASSERLQLFSARASLRWSLSQTRRLPKHGSPSRWGSGDAVQQISAKASMQEEHMATQTCSSINRTLGSPTPDTSLLATSIIYRRICKQIAS